MLSKYKMSDLDVPAPPRKLPPEYDSQMDNLFYLFVKPASTFFRYLNFTPNNITTVSLICGIMSIYFLYHRQLALFCLFYILAYFFDCVDGFHARRYKMVSKLGDAYDHVKDISVNMIVFAMLVYHIYKTKSYIEGLILLVLFLLTLQQLGMQETYIEHNESPTLDFLQYLSGSTCKEGECPNLKYSRFFGNGNFIIMFCILTCLILRKHK